VGPIPLREILQIDFEELAELQKQRNRDGALVVFDQIEIAGRDPQPPRQLDLRQPLVKAQPPHLVPQSRLLRHSQRLPDLHTLRFYQIY
jgi:hypothetical protein